jgi:hypothetical protein
MVGTVVLIAPPAGAATPSPALADVVSDYDGDGLSDVAASAVGRDVAGQQNVGLVAVGYTTTNAVAALAPGQNGLVGAPTLNQAFGSALATGDFNGDGYDDLAIGAPGDGVGDVAARGSVTVVYGSSSGLDPASSDYIYAATPGIPGEPTPDTRFGSALAAGDFNNDGNDDLAIGAIGVNVLNHPNAGTVTVIRGTPTGITGAGAVRLQQGLGGIPGGPENGDRFGETLAAGDVNGDQFVDLLVAAPGEAIAPSTTTDDGYIALLRGSAQGITGAGSQSVNGPSGSHELLGASLATGDVNGDGFADVVAGAPQSGTGANNSTGRVVVLRGASAGMSAARATSFQMGTGGVPGPAAPNLEFGRDVSLGDVTGDGRDELLASAPGRAGGGANQVGALVVLPGSASGTTTAGAQLVTQDSAGVSGTAETGDRFGTAIARDANGDGRAEVVVAAPGETVDGARAAGVVTALAGTPSGARGVGVPESTLGTLGLGSPADVDQFGRTLA